MKKRTLLFFSAAVALMTLTIWQTNAQNVTTPRAVSPAAELKQTIGISTVTVNYSRPKVTIRGNDRTDKIWGQQISYGFEQTSFVDGRQIPWRAGANENTVITFSDDVKIEGKNLAAGSYGLHMAVYKDGKATVIFSKNTSSWGSFYYDEKEDALRVDVQSQEIGKTEVLTYDFTEIGNNYGVLALSWEKKRIPFKIEVNVHDVVLANFRDELRSIPGFGWQGLNQAANYCLTNNVNLEEGLQWVERSIANNKNFQNQSVKAGLLGQLGKTAEAQKVNDELVASANNAQLNAMGYRLLGQGNTAKALEYFRLNVKRNPKDPNVHDSLGDGYRTAGDKNNAIKSYKKSISLNPPANVKANSISGLKALGVDVSNL